MIHCGILQCWDVTSAQWYEFAHKCWLFREQGFDNLLRCDDPSGPPYIEAEMICWFIKRKPTFSFSDTELKFQTLNVSVKFSFNHIRWSWIFGVWTAVYWKSHNQRMSHWATDTHFILFIYTFIVLFLFSNIWETELKKCSLFKWVQPETRFYVDFNGSCWILNWIFINQNNDQLHDNTIGSG